MKNIKFYQVYDTNAWLNHYFCGNIGYICKTYLWSILNYQLRSS